LEKKLAKRAPLGIVLLRYVAFQLPGAAFIGAVLVATVRWWGVDAWMAALLFVAWIVKDAIMFPFVRVAYEPHSDGGALALQGRSAVAEEALSPGGYVRMGSELWRAELTRGSAAAGETVRVVEVDGLTLMVEREERQGGST
jgi:membrane protein implicated in regulation of membrane protease activity